MKKYILTDQNTLVGIIKKLVSKTLTARVDNSQYTILSYSTEKDINKSVHICIKAINGKINKPDVLISIAKDNKVEIRIKQVNPYQDDLFLIQEIIITPLERSAKRASIKNIKLLNLHYSPSMDLTSLLSLYGKTSIITQTLQNFQMNLENILNKYGYFITKVNVGFYYAANTPLLNQLADAKSPYFLRDAYRKLFYTERMFFNPQSKIKEEHINSFTQKHLIENVKSVLIVPFFAAGNTLLGYVELQSSLPNLGNDGLNYDIESSSGISAIMSFMESRCEDLTFELELAYVKEWKFFSAEEDIIDISEDGKGMGCYIAKGSQYPFLQQGAKIAFSILINGQNYEFFAGIKNAKPSSYSPEAVNMGVRIYISNPPDGIGLLSTYAEQLINSSNIRTNAV